MLSRNGIKTLAVAGFLIAMSNSANAGICNKLTFAAIGAGSVASASTIAGSFGLTAVAHSSTAAILTGSTGYIAGTLGTMGTTALAAVSAPAVIVGGTVLAVTTGSVALYCYVKK